jgi:hypothetical protein
LLALPSQRSTWDAAAALGVSINDAYWKDATFFVHNETAENVDYGIAQMVSAGRAPEVVERIANDSSAIDSETILRVLYRATCDPLPTGNNDVVMFQWGIARLLTRLETDSAVSEDAIAQLEWQYLAVLEHSERPAKMLHRFMSSRPQFFVEVLSAVYRASELTLLHAWQIYRTFAGRKSKASEAGGIAFASIFQAYRQIASSYIGKMVPHLAQQHALSAAVQGGSPVGQSQDV